MHSNCPACRRDNRVGARFCAGCGRELPQLCRACGSELPKSAAFCDACGAPVEGVAGSPERAGPRAASGARDPRAYTPGHLAQRILTNRGALEGERKHVTVLFADVAGFTALSEARDPEEMHGLMDRFFQLVLDEVHRTEGTVNQFLGDGVMALFGAPVALENAPHRALRSALAIQAALSELAKEGSPLPLRIGIHAGPVVVGRIGDDLRMDYTAVGDTTNLAARLQQLARPGEILVSEAIHRLVHGFFDLEDLGSHELRGKSEPVRAFRVLGERPVGSRVDARAETGLTPLVARERELAALRDAFASAREGRGRACFLVGDAGIGKSRLLFEFRRGLQGVPHVWFEGRCASYGSTTAFQFVVDGVQRFFDIDDRDDDTRALAKLSAGVAALGGDLAWTAPFLQKLLSLPVADEAVEALDAISRRSQTIQALQALFLRAAEKDPLVLVVEDLHWIDPASEEFLELLIDAIPTAKVCLLLTHRPGYRQPFGDRSYHVRVALDPLSPHQMAEMAGALLEAEGIHAGLRSLIAEKAEGNPFFVEEVTKTLLEDGALRVEGGHATLVRSADEIAVPDSIHDVLAARIDRLEEEPKRAIQVASVIGREFALRLLDRIVETGSAMQEVVSELRTLELIYQKAAHPELAFMFKHALTHDVAYDSVLRERRRNLHGVVGRAIEELYADRLGEHYEALANHFEQAEDWERALLYHERAARKAADAYANRSASDHLRAALAIAERLGARVPSEQRCRLAEGLGHCGYCLSDFRESGEAYVLAARYAEDDERRARNLARAGHSYLWAHDYEAGNEAAVAGIELARRSGSQGAEAIGLCAKSHVLVICEGIAAMPREEVARQESLARSSDDDEAIAVSGGQEGLWANMCGDYGRALSASEEAVTRATRTDLPHLVVIPHWVIGMALTAMGDYARGMPQLRATLDVCTRIGDRALRSRMLNTLGWCYGEIGCHHEASAFNREGAALAHDLVELGLVPSAPEILSNARINLACNRVALGDVDGAFELLDPIRAELESPGDPWQRWRYGMHTHDALARAWLAKGEPERALPLLEAELAAAKAHSARKVQARALELRGRALLHMDRREEAASALQDAHAVATEIGYPPALWRSLSLLAEIARRSGDIGRATRLLADAQELVRPRARALPETELREEFGRLEERLASDPLGAYR